MGKIWKEYDNREAKKEKRREMERKRKREKQSKTNKRYSIARIVVSNIRVRKFGLECLQ